MTSFVTKLFTRNFPFLDWARVMSASTVEQRVASLEGGLAALLLSSGQAAETFAILAARTTCWPDSGNFDFGKNPGKFPGFNTPDPTYNGLVYARDLGAEGAPGANLSYILKARVQLLRDLGSAVSPFNAFLIAQGLETLSLRVERHVANALSVAEWLEARSDVESVAYAGLPSSPWYERGRKYGPKGTGAIVSFNIAWGRGR